MNKTYGALMRGEMIRAYKDKLKTETRRTNGLNEINKAPDEWRFNGFHAETHRAIFLHRSGRGLLIRPPYGWVGEDTLWFKETYAPMCREADFGYCSCETEEEKNRNHYVEYRADTNNKYPGDWPEDEAKGNPAAPKWHSSMFMKHEYARFKNIPILDVRIERLQNISEVDAWNEGCPRDVAQLPGELIR